MTCRSHRDKTWGQHPCNDLPQAFKQFHICAGSAQGTSPGLLVLYVTQAIGYSGESKDQTVWHQVRSVGCLPCIIVFQVVGELRGLKTHECLWPIVLGNNNCYVQTIFELFCHLIVVQCWNHYTMLKLLLLCKTLKWFTLYLGVAFNNMTKMVPLHRTWPKQTHPTNKTYASCSPGLNLYLEKSITAFYF